MELPTRMIRSSIVSPLVCVGDHFLHCYEDALSPRDSYELVDLHHTYHLEAGLLGEELYRELVPEFLRAHLPKTSTCEGEGAQEACFCCLVADDFGVGKSTTRKMGNKICRLWAPVMSSTRRVYYSFYMRLHGFPQMYWLASLAQAGTPLSPIIFCTCRSWEQQRLVLPFLQINEYPRRVDP